MRRLLLLVLLALLAWFPVSSLAGYTHFDSVRPLTMVRMNQQTHTTELANICTVSGINAKKRYWLTAAHCIDGDEPKYIVGERIRVIMRDVINDIAIVQTPLASVPALRLSQHTPEVEDIAKVIGHPFGYVYPFMTTGTIASVYALLDDDPVPYMIIAAPGAPGNSGSPILDARYEIISVLQIGWGRNVFSPVMGGATYDVLARYRSYWE